MKHLPIACVFCGHRPLHANDENVYLSCARELAKSLVSNGFRVLTGGGGSGVMHSVTKTALESGGEVFQIIPEFLLDREGFSDLENATIVASMAERKDKMLEMSDVFILTFGGIGSLDEFFEVITAVQLGLLSKSKAPLIVLNYDGYWKPLQDLLDHMISHDFLPETNRDLFLFVSTVEEAVDQAKKILAKKTA